MDRLALIEVGKFARLTFIWLCVIFGAVWAACWLVGVALPLLLEYGGQADAAARMTADIFKALVPVVAVMVFIPINAMFMVLAERRALALFTVRKGPNRVGPDGLLQTAADAFKLLLKEDTTPRGADVVMFTAAPIIFFAPSIIGVFPLLAAATNNHRLFQVADIPTGIFFVLAVSSIPVVGLVMGAWASNNKYSLVGGLRSAAQAISYEIPLVLAIATVCLLAQTLDVVKIVELQQGGLFHWNLFGGGALVKWWDAVGGGGLAQAFSETLQSSGALAAVVLGLTKTLAAPLLMVSSLLLFLIYITGACAEVNRIPFDLPEAESELVSGFNTEYSGIKFAIFFLAEFTNLFVVCTIAAVMFLGGGSGPIPALDQAASGALTMLLKAVDTVPVAGWLIPRLIDPGLFVAAVWIIIKAYTLVLFAILVRATLPRFRIDQLMDFGWKRLIPLSLILLLAVVFLRELA